MKNPCFGLLLAGGQARRMGGGDKGLHLLGGKTILARAIEIMAPQCQGLVLNANGEPGRFQAFGLPVVADSVPGFAGPLAGLLAGLDWIAAHDPSIAFCVSVPCDAPFLPEDLAARLIEARSAMNADLAMATSGGSAHPVVALWPAGIRQELRHALTVENMHKVGAFTGRYRVADCDWPVSPIDPFFNANEPQDMVAAEALLGQGALG